MFLRAVTLLAVALAASPASAGGRVELAARGVSGNVWARITAGDRVVEGSAWASLQFGPTFDCSSTRLGYGEFRLGVFGPTGILGGHGTFDAGRGRARPALDPVAFVDELADAYRVQCEEGATPEACAAALTALAPRLVRSQLEIRPRANGATAEARLRGRIELELVDPASGSAAFRWSLAFRDEAPLEVYRPYSTGFCGIFFPLGG